MKTLVGSALVLFCIAFFTLLILRIWGISIVSWPLIIRSGITFVLLGGFIVVLAIIYFLFLKSNKTRQGVR